MNRIRSSHRLHCLCLGLCLIAGCAKKTPATTSTQPEVFAGTAGRNVVLQLPMDAANKLIMMNIGRSYQMACIPENKPPKNAEELGLEPRQLKTKRDMQDRDVEVAYGVDVKKLGDNAADYALAWEKTPDNNNGRMVLMADYVTVKYVSTAEFEAMKKAK
jgi:hypothetical protein